MVFCGRVGNGFHSISLDLIKEFEEKERWEKLDAEVLSRKREKELQCWPQPGEQSEQES